MEGEYPEMKTFQRAYSSLSNFDRMSIEHDRTNGIRRQIPLRITNSSSS